MEAVHFLSRLARVEQSQVELAMTLYHDPGLVKYFLRNIQLPEGAERVAISLGEQQGGPYLIVTREGIFVTCLGAGMEVSDIPIISRQKLDSTMARVTDLRARYEMVRKRGGDNPSKRIMTRLMEDGIRLTREDFFAASAWAPLFHLEFATSYFGTLNTIMDHRSGLEKIKKVRPEHHTYLRRFDGLLFGTGHLALLMMMSGPQHWMEPIIDPSQRQQDAFTWGTTRYGIPLLALRGACGVSHVGKLLLPSYKRAVMSAQSRMQILSAMLGLGALALGHSKLRAEIRKVLERFRGEVSPEDSPLEQQAAKEKNIYATLLIRLMEEPEAGILLSKLGGRQLAMKHAARLPKGSPYRFTSEEEVPDDLALALAANSVGDLMSNSSDIIWTLSTLSWAARAKPEELYLPSAYARSYWGTYDHDDTIFLASRWVNYYGKERPVVAEKTQGRNEPCACSSGKKYKHCCGFKRSA
jgi:hypothetical protein